METKRIYNLTEQGCSVQRTCFMHNDNSFSQSASSEFHTEEVFDKFSPTKAMLVKDYSKRTLTTDREMAVPPKKRKQMHQESGLCDALTGQNLQKSEPNEGDMAFCSKLGEENLCTSTPSTSEKGLEGQIEFHLQSSVYVKTDEYAKWVKLECFKSITNDGASSSTFFAGGPIQSSAFSITPYDMKVNQYVAVAAGNDLYNNYSCNNTQNVSGIIQFWNVGSLHERKTLNQSPSMELALCHDNGIITHMKWCPADCYDKRPSTCHLPRLGLLAVASSSSYVYIYNVPQPDFMPKLKHELPIYFTRPLMKLTPLFGGPSYATTKAIATCIDWEKNGERIVAGYANGAVAVWRINVSSFTSNIAVKNIKPPYIIQPYLFFQASGAYITSLSFAPFNNHRWLVVSSIDKVLKFFDLHDTSAPFHVAKQGWENVCCIWSEAFCGVYATPALTTNGLISLCVKDCCAEGLRKELFDSSTCVAASEKGNCHAIADMAGTVTANFLKKIDKPSETSYLTLVVFETEIAALDITDIGQEASILNISISGNIPTHDLTSDVKDTYSKIKQGSSSSSSGFGSPKHDKAIVIEMPQCFDGDTVNSLKSPPGPSLNESRDFNNNGIKPFNSGEEADGDMVVFETEIAALGNTDMGQEASKWNISIPGNIQTHDLISDVKDIYSKIKKGSSSSSSGFGSPKHGKTILIEMPQCFDGDTVNSLKSPPGPSLNESQDFNNNGIKPFNSGEEADDDMIKGPGSSKCFMRDLLMQKISNQLKYSLDTLQLNTSNKSAHSESKGAKYLADKALITASANMTKLRKLKSDKIKYPIEPCFSDTSHPNPLTSVESKSLSINDKGNTLHETTVHKTNEKVTESSSKNCHKPNTEDCNLNYKSRDLRKNKNFGCDNYLFHSNGNNFTSTHSDIPAEEYHDSKKFPNETLKSEDTPFQNLDSKDNVIFKKDDVKLSSHESFGEPLGDVLNSNNFNQPKFMPDMPASITSNNNIICDKDYQQVSDRALIQCDVADDNSDATIEYSYSVVSDCSSKTIIYYDCDKTDINNLEMEKPGATFQSLCKSEKENTFQTEKEIDIHGAKTKLLTDNTFGGEISEHFPAKESLRKCSEYGTDSTTGSDNLSEEDRNFFPKDFLTSDHFKLLDLKYLSEKSEEKHSNLNELPVTPETASQCSSDSASGRNLPTTGIKPGPISYKNSHDLSYEDLIKSFGVIFKNNLDEFTNPLGHQENDIYIKNNSLSVIKTMSWDRNEGCQSWLCVGGNSGICRLVYVPDFVAEMKKKSDSVPKRQQPKRTKMA